MIEFMTQNAGYVVLTCTTLIWSGVAIYLWRVETRLTSIEKNLNK